MRCRWVVRTATAGILAIALGVGIGVALWWFDRREHRYDGPIREAAQRYGLPPSLVKALVWRESSFNSRARGRKGEFGLMQLMDYTAQEWADANRVTNFVHEHVFDARTNTLAGCHYLARLLKRYSKTDNPYAYTLADYNAGRGNVLKWMKGAGATNSVAFLGQCDFPGTREYVRSILRHEEKYRGDFD